MVQGQFNDHYRPDETYGSEQRLDDLWLIEQASAPTNVSGYGKLYVKSSTGHLFFLDENGNETDLSAAGGALLQAETPVGTVDGSNTSFTVTNAPLFVVYDNSFYVPGFGYTYSAPTITTALGPTLFIRSYFNGA